MAGDVNLALQQTAAVTLDRTIHPVFSQPDPSIADGPGAAGVITSTVILGVRFICPEVGVPANLAEV